MKKLKIAGLCLLAILLILAFTNPSLKDFKEFIPSQVNHSAIEKVNFEVSRESNYLVYSVFEYKAIMSYPSQKRKKPDLVENGKFLGFMLNFSRKDTKYYTRVLD